MSNIETDLKALESVKVHITGSDVSIVPARAARRTVHTPLSTHTVANVVADGSPRLLLPHAPNRVRATLTFGSAVSTDTVILAGTRGEAQTGHGATVGVLTAPLVLTSSDDLWLGLGAGTGMVVGVLAEYRD